MTIAEHQKKYNDLKSKFLSGQLKSIPPKQASIIQQWQESVDAGADPNVQFLDESSRDYEVFDRLDDLYKCHIAYFDQYYENRNKALSNLGCALLYLDNEFTVFEKAGNEELLSALKAKGIRIGTNLSPKNIGIFAGNLSPRTPDTNVITRGAEHFCEILKDYVCVARYGESPDFSSFKSNNVIIIPNSLFTKSLHTTVIFLLESEDFSFKRSPMYPHIRQKFELLEKSAQFDADIMLLIDTEGQIVFFNNKFEKEFGKIARQCIGKKLETVLPGMQNALRSMRSGNNLSSKELVLPDHRGVGHFYYMDLLTMKENGEILGAKITLQPAKKLNEITSKYVGNISRFTFDDIIGNSPSMQFAKTLGMRASQNASTVLITGESGTGKELFAHAIHSASDRSNAPFIPINCGAIPKELIGTELFGYEGGSFTGANKNGNPGKIELADGGTLFLDEIGEMPLDMQAFLLRFLEDGVVNRIGGKTYQNVDVRIISATNRDLLECVEEGTFRMDLYYRLNVMRIELPALREHIDDLPALVNHFLKTLTPKHDKIITEIAPATLHAMRRYNWPGNIRELRNIVERCIINTEDRQPLGIDPVTKDRLKKVTARSISSKHYENLAIPNHQTHEEETLRSLMIEFRGNKSKVAQALGISRGTLYKRLDEIDYYKK